MPKYDFKISDEIVELEMSISDYEKFQKTGKVKDPRTGLFIFAERVWGNENPPNLRFIGKWFSNGGEY